MRFYLIAGEASGDLHGSNLIKALKALNPDSEFRAWGGDKMKAAGADLMKHFRDHAFMGFIPVIQNLSTIKKNFALAKEDILDWKPDALILIDYSGFNLRLAKMLSPAPFKVFYYISPQVWAWRSSRVNKIKAFTNQLFSILPFEKAFYKKYNFDIDYVGHPLLDVIGEFRESYTSSFQEFTDENKLSDKPVIGILPGSRRQEIEAKLPIMIEASKYFKDDYQFVVAGTTAADKNIYDSIEFPEHVKIVFDKTYEILNWSEAAMVTSGTATMETAIFEVPQVVCYKADKFSYILVKSLVGSRIKYISMVNLIMEREVVKELIQDDLTSKNIVQELKKVLVNGSDRVQVKEDYSKLIDKLGNRGASKRAAEGMLKLLST